MTVVRIALGLAAAIGVAAVGATSLAAIVHQPSVQASADARAHLNSAIAASDSGPAAGLFQRIRLTRSMRSHLDRAAELAPEDPDVLGELARFHLSAPGIFGGRIEKAAESGERLLASSSDRGHVVLGWVAHHRARRLEAERHFLAAIEAAPESAEAHLGLGHLYRDADRADDAVRYLSRGLELRPDYRLGYLDLANITSQTGTSLAIGESAIRRYLELPHRRGEPAEHVARYRLGVILEKQGRIEEARTEYQAALRLRRGEMDYQRAVKRLSE